uniref:ABC transporter permease n=1 Tax=Lophosiphonia teges TaxID=2007110 RepID=A0A1Z1MVI4_9FLOR|nr:hypothetical protein [Polysiphonia teges]
MKMSYFLERIRMFIKVLTLLVNTNIFLYLDYRNFLEQIIVVGPNSLFITVTTSFFISLVLSLQIVKEFLYLNAINLVSSVLVLSFIRELSPVLTSIIVIGKIGSFFTSEIATMVVTDQIDALLILGINPVYYLIAPRVFAVTLLLPILNLFSIFTSFLSSAFICFVLYLISPQLFFLSISYKFLLSDLIKSITKAVIFGLCVSIVSCVWGITAKGGSQGVGLSTTSSVIVSLLLIFILNFILSYLMFSDLTSSFEMP